MANSVFSILFVFDLVVTYIVVAIKFRDFMYMDKLRMPSTFSGFSFKMFYACE